MVLTKQRLDVLNKCREYLESQDDNQVNLVCVDINFRLTAKRSNGTFVFSIHLMNLRGYVKLDYLLGYIIIIIISSSLYICFYTKATFCSHDVTLKLFFATYFTLKGNNTKKLKI